MCFPVVTDWELSVTVVVSTPGRYDIVVVHNGIPICGLEAVAIEGEGMLPTIGGPALQAIAGITDSEARFSVLLPMPGTTASGRLLDPSGSPLARQRFTLTPIARGPAISSPEDITGFVFAVPGFARTLVSKFSRFSLFGLTSFILGDVKLETIELPWSADHPLTWDDFQGEPPVVPGEEGARIAVRFGFAFEYLPSFDPLSGRWKAHLTKVTVTNVMDRSKSWVLPVQKTPELLNHEQKHFDLNEVYRRLAEAELQKHVCRLEAVGATEKDAKENLGGMIGDVLDKFDKKCDEVEDQYDTETDHGRNAEQQAEWDKRIAGWLADPSTAPQP